MEPVVIKFNILSMLAKRYKHTHLHRLDLEDTEPRVVVESSQHNHTQLEVLGDGLIDAELVIKAIYPFGVVGWIISLNAKSTPNLQHGIELTHKVTAASIDRVPLKEIGHPSPLELNIVPVKEGGSMYYQITLPGNLVASDALKRIKYPPMKFNMETVREMAKVNRMLNNTSKVKPNPDDYTLYSEPTLIESTVYSI